MFLYVFFVILCFPSFGAASYLEQFKEVGYVELSEPNHSDATYESLYETFDVFTEFLKNNRNWQHKLYSAKERFTRSKKRDCYATDFFGLYDESQKVSRGQIAFYYSVHFHEFIIFLYPEINQIPEINNFLQSCFQIQNPCQKIMQNVALDMHLESIFDSDYLYPPILLKVVKYLPSYVPARPHYDGTAFSLFLHSTDNQSLLVSAYKPVLMVDDFTSVVRILASDVNRSSLVLIPGTLLTEYSIYPTPHIVMQSGKVRYATIAFTMRPYHISLKNDFSALPAFLKVE